jgi:hypothetical protein
MSKQEFLVGSEGVVTILLMHSQYFRKIPATENALIVKLIQSREGGKLRARKLSKRVKVEAINR